MYFQDYHGSKVFGKHLDKFHVYTHIHIHKSYSICVFVGAYDRHNFKRDQTSHDPLVQSIQMLGDSHSSFYFAINAYSIEWDGLKADNVAGKRMQICKQ